MGERQNIYLDVSFPDEVKAMDFAIFCLNTFHFAPAVKRKDVYLVLQTLDDRSAAFMEIQKLGGVVLRNDN